MTRINSAIAVRNLTNEHLLAEHREIKRLPACFLKAKQSGALKRIPKVFCLGTGHVTFFLNKQHFLYNRYLELYKECIARGFKVENYESSWLDIKDELIEYNCWNDYKPTVDEELLLIDRIADRILDSSKTFHYKDSAVSKHGAIKLLIQQW